MPTQSDNGKAFEYAILREFKEKLNSKTNIHVVDNPPLRTAKNCFEKFNNQEQGRFLLTASFAVNFLMDIEPRLSNDIGKDDILQLSILADFHGQSGDVRDVIAIRLIDRWEIGVSAKNNHRAVKHSRLSSHIDFGEKWLGIKCSDYYFSEVIPIFAALNEIKIRSNSTKKWSSLPNKNLSVYIPVLKSFRRELERLYNDNGSIVPRKLVEYLVGNKDFYKVIKLNNSVEIHAYNLRGSLNHPFVGKNKTIEPKFITPIVDLPNIIENIYFKKNSKTTIIVELNKGWSLSFRIHNASSKVEPSLKFDINLLSSPNTLFTNTLSTN